MRVVIERVNRAEARLDGVEVASIDRGLVVLVGLSREDDRRVVARMAGKVARVRVFDTGSSLFGRSIIEEVGEILTVAQLPLCADTQRGSKPNFSRAAPIEMARELYTVFAEDLVHLGISRVRAAPFANRLTLHTECWGPFTMVLDAD
jgi:D-tyrosyl-tRNA(Tyr) deacylase